MIAPISGDAVVDHELVDAQRERVVAGIVQEDQRVEEVVVGPQEGEQRRRRQRRLDQRHDDVPEDAVVRAAVDARRVGQVVGDRHHELPQQEDEERVAGQRRPGQRAQRTQPADPLVQVVGGDQRGPGRQDQRDQHEREEHVASLERMRAKG